MKCCDGALKVMFTLALLAVAAGADEAPRFELPTGGWRFAAKPPAFLQEVNYPASMVSMPEQKSDFGTIRGLFGDTSQGQGQLVVNGLQMPMRVENGRFERPYSFGPGSNSVQASSPDGEKKMTVQFYEANSKVTKPLIRVILSWDTDQTDLDLHVVTPDGEHCSYAKRVLDNGGALDVDVTTGYGPEIFASPAPVTGAYLVYVNYYGSGERKDLTTATVHVVTNENTVDEKKQSFSVPMRKPGELTHVASFVYP